MPLRCKLPLKMAIHWRRPAFKVLMRTEPESYTIMIGLLSIVALGFFLGMRHATDPDHVIAVTTIVSRYRKISHAALIGAFWGVGHTLTILVVGGGIILFGWVIPTRIGLSMEFSVGLMLIFLGILNMTGMLQWIANSYCSADSGSGNLAMPHSRSHDQGDHIHTHAQQSGCDADSYTPDQTPLSWSDRHFGRLGVYQVVRPLIVGLVHGLAGSAAVALLVLTTIRNPRWAIVYLAVFGTGTIAGMMLITGAMVLPFAYADTRFSRLNRGLRIASGLISAAFGLFIVYEIGFVNGLFTSHPQWTPR
jgi:ABC-type nickel/cobalt efflux system permease component RcnA